MDQSRVTFSPGQRSVYEDSPADKAAIGFFTHLLREAAGGSDPSCSFDQPAGPPPEPTYDALVDAALALEQQLRPREQRQVMVCRCKLDANLKAPGFKSST